MGKLGDYIARTKETAPYNKDIPVKGLSVDKCFVDTYIPHLDKIKVPFQIIKKNQFAYAPVTSRNGDKLSIAFNNSLEKVQISTTYIVFQIVNEDLLNCFYLDLFFKRTRIDKIARYASTGSVRESLSFRNFSWFPISIPPLEKQQKIVYKYQTVSKYIELKKRINELLEKRMVSIFHLLIDNQEHLITKSYGELFSVIRGGRPPRWNKEIDEKYFCRNGGIPWLQVRDISKKGFKFVDEASEQLTQEGFKRGNCHMVSPKDLIFIHNASSQQLGKVYVNSTDLTINTNFWGFSVNLARGGGMKIASP